MHSPHTLSLVAVQAETRYEFEGQVEQSGGGAGAGVVLAGGVGTGVVTDVVAVGPTSAPLVD